MAPAEMSGAVVVDSATVLAFVGEGLADAVVSVFGGPFVLTPDALEPCERGGEGRPRSRVLRAADRERRSHTLEAGGPVERFVRSEGRLWVPAQYGEREAGVASALRSCKMNGVRLTQAVGPVALPAQWLGAGHAEALAVAWSQGIPFVTRCTLTQRVARRAFVDVVLYDGSAIAAAARRATRLAS